MCFYPCRIVRRQRAVLQLKRKPETKVPNVTCPILTPISFQRMQFQLEKLLCGHMFKEKAPQKLNMLKKWSFAIVKYIAKKTIFAHQMRKEEKKVISNLFIVKYHF